MQSWLFQPVTTGIPSFSATRMNTGCAPAMRIPFPAFITGRSAALTLSTMARAVSRVTFGARSSRLSPAPARSSGIWCGFPAFSPQPVPPAS